jgi:hypothetical protein
VAGLAGSNGNLITTTPLSALPPGGSTLTSLTCPVGLDSNAGLYQVQVTSGVLTFSQPNPITLKLSQGELPDVIIPPGGVHASTLSPSDGETVFFDVTIINNGNTAADYVKLEGSFGTSETQKMESRISGLLPGFTLEPHTSRTLRLRWDPFHNAGPQHVTITASSQSADLNPANNAQSVDLRVRTKARVHAVYAGVIEPLTAEDIANRQIRVKATLRNDGETDAQGIKVVFYPTPRINPKEAMGEAIVEVLRAGEQVDAVLTYKLKPGEENKSFQPTCETMLKGSLQRTPLTATH